jgi:hypothetical protein
MAREENSKNYPVQVVDEDCPECGDRLREHEEFWVGIAKAIVVGVAGCSASVDVSSIVHAHLWAITHGQPGLGIDLGWVLAALVPLLAGVVWWAFPKKDKKK